MQTGAEPQRTAKIAFPVDKADWHPSVLPGPIVLVSTVDMQGEPNIAPKSWISMMAFRGPVVAFGCHSSHDPPGDQDVEARMAFLRSLRDSGILLMAGPYDGWREEPDRSHPTGMIILAAADDRAREIAETDPLVRAGGRYVIRRWDRTF
jgi:uncharacterized protein YciI